MEPVGIEKKEEKRRKRAKTEKRSLHRVKKLHCPTINHNPHKDNSLYRGIIVPKISVWHTYQLELNRSIGVSEGEALVNKHCEKKGK